VEGGISNFPFLCYSVAQREMAAATQAKLAAMDRKQGGD
jgi:hypothetical protein